MEESPELLARRARRYIRTHPEETIRTLLAAGRLPRCTCYDSIVQDSDVAYLEDDIEHDDTA